MTATKFQDIGIRLRVAPRTMGKDHISLTIRPNVSLRGELLEGRFPVIETREVETQLMVGNGQTAVIGGLMQDRTEKTRTGIPGLMNIEALGHLFGRRISDRAKTELMIFVTPRLVATGAPVATAPEGREGEPSN